jgi:AraC-like DNA-binding protein
MEKYMQELCEYEYHFPSFDLSQLRLLFCGHERCSPNAYDGPSMRDHYVFHLVLSGSGLYTAGGHTYRIGRDMCFMISPDTVTHHAADEQSPWEYIWMGVSGDALGDLLRYSSLTADMPVFTPPDFRLLSGTLMDMIKTLQMGGTANIVRCYGLMLLFLSQLLDQTSVFDDHSIAPAIESMPERYLREAIGYMKKNLHNNFSVSDVAERIGLSRSYFSKIFTERCGKTPVEFILSYRLNNAWHLLQYTNLSTEQIAQSVGFNDPAYFTRQFTRRYGRSPRSLRNLVRQAR